MPGIAYTASTVIIGQNYEIIYIIVGRQTYLLVMSCHALCLASR